MTILRIYVDEATLKTLAIVAEERGEDVAVLAANAVSQAALDERKARGLSFGEDRQVAWGSGDAAIGSDLKTCADCRHYFKGHARAAGMCRGPQRIRGADRVTGQTVYPATSEYERSRLWRWFGLDTCGPEARYFEEQDPAQSRA